MPKHNRTTEAAKEKAENRKRERKEVATKLRNLGSVAQVEVVNEVISKQVSKQVGGFADFLREQSIIGIGIGLVLGTQLKTVVDSITANLVLPLTQLFLPGKQKFTDLTFATSLHGRHTLINWGDIVYTMFNFLVVALIVYIIFKALKLDKLAKKK